MAIERPYTRLILRTVLIVVLAALAIYIVYRLRKPISWLVIAAFLAIAMTGPVNLLERVMKRGLAIAVAYLALILIPIGLGILFVPSLVGQAEDLAQNVPQYAKDVTEFVNDNQTLDDLNEKYDITAEIEKAAGELPSRIGDAATVLKDIGVGVVNSIFSRGHHPRPLDLHGGAVDRDGRTSCWRARPPIAPSVSTAPRTTSRTRSATTSAARSRRPRSRRWPPFWSWSCWGRPSPHHLR